MVYMAGDNSLSSYVDGDLEEMEEGLYNAVSAGNDDISDDVTVLVLVDQEDSSDTKLYCLSPDSDTRTFNSTQIIDDSYPENEELNMADPDTLEEFLEYGTENYPSAYNALILWNHGGGAKSTDSSESVESVTRELCSDETNVDDYLYLNELQTALENAAADSGVKLNIIGADACLMGTVETAYEVKDYADYFVASPASEWSAGWDYSCIFDDFYIEDSPPSPAELADILVDQYYESTYSTGDSYTHTMTAIDTAALDDLKVAIDDFAAALYTAYESDSTILSAFETCRDESVLYGYTYNDYEVTYFNPQTHEYITDTYDYPEFYHFFDYSYYDIYDLCEEIVGSGGFGTDVEAQAAAVQEALDAAAAGCYADADSLGLAEYYETADADAVRGLSIFISDSSEAYAYHSWYTTDDVSVEIDGTSYDLGGLDFCTSSSDEEVDTWSELFEAWYDE